MSLCTLSRLKWKWSSGTVWLNDVKVALDLQALCPGEVKREVGFATQRAQGKSLAKELGDASLRHGVFTEPVKNLVTGKAVVCLTSRGIV